MKEKVVFITGGADGIGLAIAEVFVSANYSVTVCDINSEKLSKVVDKFESDGANILGVQCDVTEEEQLIESIQTTIEKFGTISVLVNNAGQQFISPIESFPVEKFEQMIKLMLTSPFMAIKHVFPIMKNQKFGRIINIASINGLIGFAGKSAYNSAKHGLIGLTRVAALEGAGHNITVNAICPGYVDTKLVRNQLSDLAKMRNTNIDEVLSEIIFPLVPTKRLLSSEEVARYVLFIADEKNENTTGQAIVIDGGYTVQ